MALKQKVSTLFKNWGSKRTENSDIKDYEADIAAEQDSINIKIADIGEFYWNLYSKNAFVPEPESKEMFLSIKNSMERIEFLRTQIEDTKKNASDERVHNNEELKALEEREAQEAADRRKQREASAEEERKRREAKAEFDRLNKEAAAKAAREDEGKVR